MSQSLKDILSGLSTDIDQETLLLYLQGKLSEEKKHEIEKKLMDSEFENDAVEGLQQFKNTQDVQIFVEQLNLDLRNKLKKKKKYREKMRIKHEPWLYIVAIIIILLIAISYFVIRNMLKN